jgi:NAD(P)H-dependent flavin oxidoreductase YrpB (nitropropane dioxygenase family)
MTQKFSQAALALFNYEKAKWAELQFVNAIDQLLSAQDEILKLKEQLDEANKRIDKLSKESGGNNGG